MGSENSLEVAPNPYLQRTGPQTRNSLCSFTDFLVSVVPSGPGTCKTWKRSRREVGKGGSSRAGPTHRVPKHTNLTEPGGELVRLILWTTVPGHSAQPGNIMRPHEAESSQHWKCRFMLIFVYS